MFGEAIRPDSDARVTPEALRAEWDPGTQASPWRTWDGFFAAIVFDKELGVVAGADLLGIFPFYYWSNGEVLLMASSPEPFQHHPSFRRVFDPVALVGIMLTNGLVGGRSLWRGVRRMQAAHFLRFSFGRVPTESADSTLTTVLSQGERPTFSGPELLESLNGAFEQAFRRHVPLGEPCGLFLSGGLDSRLVAGYLDRQGTRSVALTLGVPADLEMRCARRVARELGLEHRAASVPFESFPFFAEELTSRWEHLANGGNAVFGWGARAFMEEFPARIANGIPMDWLVGGPHAFGRDSGSLSFDRGFAEKVNNFGFSPVLLARLLRPEVFRGAVQEIIEEVRAEHDALGDEPLRRLWRLVLLHRVRFHAGSLCWHLSFGSWPVMISLDRGLIGVVASLPLPALAGRKAEEALLCREFPALARLPLDRNGYLTTPLTAGRVRRLLAKFPSYARTRWIAPRLGLKVERRYYYRVFDLDNEGWRAVRRRAEPWRNGLRTLFVPEVLDEVLPPPDQQVRYEGDLIADGSKVKQLLILALWARDHL